MANMHQFLKAMIEKGAAINLADPEGVTPLLWATWNTRFDVAKYLIEHGADVNRWDWWGRTPLYLAVDYVTLPHGGRPDQPSRDESIVSHASLTSSSALATPMPAKQVCSCSRVTTELREMCERYFGGSPLVLEPGIRTGMPIMYDNPKEVGADRIANAVAAYDLYGGPSIVVDFGTANTIQPHSP